MSAAPSSSSRILVVEDELNVGSTLVERLEKEGFQVKWAKTAGAAQTAVEAGGFDLALLDVGLPDGSGFDVASSLRRRDRATAIIFLTAFGSPEDRVKGLELGAEDYVVKPFHLKELLLRIRNVLNRSARISTGASEGVRIGQATVYFSKFEAHANGEVHQLTHKECALLKFLVDRKGQVVSRDDILNEIWSENEYPTTRTVDNFVMRLRRLVEADPEKPQVIRSVRGVGYLLSEDQPS